MAEKAHDEHKKEGHGGGHKKHGGGGHGGAHEEHHEGAPEWLISFADNVALMMGFFVVLLAMNMAKQTAGGIGGEEKNAGGDPTSSTAPAATTPPVMLDFALAMREAFNNPVDINSSKPEEQALVQRLIERMGTKEAVTDGIKGADRDVQSIRPSDYHAVSGSIPFAESSADLSAAGSATVKDVAGKIRGMTLMVEVRGHASAAEAYEREEFGMRLSMDRAMVVARALSAMGVDWWQMRVIAASDHDRIERFPKGKADDQLNARVEVVVTDEVVPPQVPISGTD